MNGTRNRYFGLSGLVTLLVLLLVVLASPSLSQSPSATRSSNLTTSAVLDPNVPSDSSVSNDRIETWFGWLETPKQQLRMFVKIKRDAQGKVESGSMLSPDEADNELPWNSYEIKTSGDWTFEVRSPIATQPSVQFIGTQTSANRVKGAIHRGDENVVVILQKLETAPLETRDNLGADSIWHGTIDLVVRKVELRVREYFSPPFGSPELPRILVDFTNQNVPGVPAQLTTTTDGKRTLEMKTIDAKFVGRLNEAEDEWEGRFTQGKMPLKLLLKKHNATPVAEASALNKQMRPSVDDSEIRKQDLAKEADVAKEPDLTKEPAKPSVRAGETVPKPNRRSTEFYDEMPFEVVVVKASVKKGKEVISEPGVKLTGTLTIPKQNENEARRFPAVVMVSGSGPQDRDETIGRHKPFQVMAQYLAKIGIASLRYDDRGVGESSGDYFNATTEEFAKDALAVWKFARSVPEIDSSKVGLLGHSEGGAIGPMAAIWEPDIAFLILLAPPGLNGSEVLKSQIDRISELQGMSPADRKATMGLQARLQEIASGYITDEAALRREIQTAVRLNWDGLKSIALSQDPAVNLEQMRRELTQQIEMQFQQLRMPWYKYYLNYDPAPNWMLIRCPTLAIWGSNDVLILPELNREKIHNAIKRNPYVEVQLNILPGLNHLLQTSQTGLPEEYEAIDESVSPAALELIRSWAVEHGVIESKVIAK